MLLPGVNIYYVDSPCQPFHLPCYSMCCISRVLYFKWPNYALLVQVSVKTYFNYVLFVCQYVLFHISNNSDLMPVAAVYHMDIILSDISHYYLTQTVSLM